MYPPHWRERVHGMLKLAAAGRERAPAKQTRTASANGTNGIGGHGERVCMKYIYICARISVYSYTVSNRRDGEKRGT